MASAESRLAAQGPGARRTAGLDAAVAAPAGSSAPGDALPDGEAGDAPVSGAGAVTVIVVTFDSEEAIATCLDGIPGDCAVHVVDNASRDGTLDRVAAAERPGLRVTRMAQNEGFGRACNRALAEVSTRQALLLNPDAAITPAALARLSAMMAVTGNLAILAPRVTETGAAPAAPVPSPAFAAGEREASGGRSLEPTDSRAAGVWHKLHDVEEVTGSCVLLDMEKLRRIGFFDESIFLYYEDSDLCRRARAAGFRVCVATDVAAIHRSGDSSSAMRTGDLLRERLLGQSYAYFTAKHHPHPRRRNARKALAHLSAGLGCLVTGRRVRARARFARMRGILDYLLRGRRALWANRLAER
jgi:N-acetylglucosaminyl-diphospho-decaprenol L-rhamnosyltransferase